MTERDRLNLEGCGIVRSLVWRRGGWMTTWEVFFGLSISRGGCTTHHQIKLRRPRAIKWSRAAVSLNIDWDFFETPRPNSDYCVSSKLPNFPWTMSNYKPMFTEDIWVDVTFHRIRRHWEVVRKLVLSRDVEGILAIFECVQQSRRASCWRPCQEMDEQVHRLEKRVEKNYGLSVSVFVHGHSCNTIHHNSIITLWFAFW